jgi:predicted nucleic acid-binding Zn ribbon protein
MQRMTDDPVTKCEVCGAPVERVFHPIAVHFKGKGFYNTDYGTRRRQRELASSAESGANATADKAASSSSDGASSSSSSDSNRSKPADAKKSGSKPAASSKASDS